MASALLLFHVFIEAAHKASVIPLASEVTLQAMKAFGGFQIEIAYVAAVLGGLAGHVFNYYVGKSLLWLPATNKPPAILLKARPLFNRYGFIILFFAFAPLCNLLVVVAGISGCKLWKVLAVVAMGLMYHYSPAFIAGSGF